MPSRVFVVTLGYHEDHAIRLLTVAGASREDKVVALTSKPVTPAVKRAFDGLRVFALRVGLEEPELVEVPPDLPEGLAAVIKVLSSYDAEYVLSLSGGMRYLVIFTLLALILSGKSATIYIYPEGGDAPEIIIPKNVVKLLRKLPTDAELRILKEVVKHPGITPEEVADVIGRKVKTVKNILTELFKAGLVSRRGRKGGIYPTKWGELIAEYLVSTSS